jgi:hypothetical protein
MSISPPTRFMAVCPPKGLSRTDEGVQRASIVHGETLEKAYGVGTNARRREVKTGEGVAVAWTMPGGAGEYHLPVSLCKESHLLVAFQGAISNRAALHAHLGAPEGTSPPTATPSLVFHASLSADRAVAANRPREAVSEIPP